MSLRYSASRRNGVVDSRVEGHLGRPAFELLGRQPLEKLDRVMIDLPPQGGVQLAEERDDVRLPDPPEIAGQFTELLDQLTLTDHDLPLWSGSRFQDTIDVSPETHQGEGGGEAFGRARVSHADPSMSQPVEKAKTMPPRSGHVRLIAVTLGPRNRRIGEPAYSVVRCGAVWRTESRRKRSQARSLCVPFRSLQAAHVGQPPLSLRLVRRLDALFSSLCSPGSFAFSCGGSFAFLRSTALGST